MGHEIQYYTHKEDVSKSVITSIANEDAECYSDSRTGLSSSIRFIDIVCEDEESAYEKIEKLDKGFYDQLAVKFKKYEPVKDSKTVLNLIARVKKYEESLALYKVKNTIKNRKSKYIGCPKCESKVNKDYVSDYGVLWNKCPVCKEDLSSTTVKESIIKKELEIKNLKEKIAQKKKEDAKKGKYSIHWLVKTEYHV